MCNFSAGLLIEAACLPVEYTDVCPRLAPLSFQKLITFGLPTVSHGNIILTAGIVRRIYRDLCATDLSLAQVVITIVDLGEICHFYIPLTA